MKQRANAVEYTVLRSKRRTADIVVERSGDVVVRAPRDVDDDRLSDEVAKRELWIHRARAEWEELNASRVRREFLAGEGFLYLGRTYRLKLIDEDTTEVKLKEGRFTLSRPLLRAYGPAAARKAFRDFYVRRGEALIPERVAHLAPKVGVEAGPLKVKELGYHWASCGAHGALNFHWKTMMAPRTVLDYVIVHELCHMHHRDHTVDFWNEVDKVLPKYRERKAWLRANGASLDL